MRVALDILHTIDFPLKGCDTMRRSMLVLLGILVSGCSPTVLPTVTTSGDTTKLDPAAKYCKELSEKADTSAQADLGVGIVGSILASAAIIAGSAMGPDTSDGANWAAKNRNTLVLGAGGILAVPTTILLMRSKDGSKASGAAGEAMALDEKSAMSTCLKARTELVNSRSALADVAQKDLTDTLAALNKVADESQKKAEELRDEAKKNPAKHVELEAEAAAQDKIHKSAVEAISEALRRAYPSAPGPAPAPAPAPPPP